MAPSGEIREDDFGFVYVDISRPWVAWSVYRGALISADTADANPAAISWFFVDTISRGIVGTLRREGVLEGVRRKAFPEKLSRLTSLYAFPTLEDATTAHQGQGKFIQDNLVAIAPFYPSFRREVYDMRWIDDFDALGPTTAARYWSGEFSKTAHREMLLGGRFAVLGTSVRRRAYELIAQRDPKSLAMLELSRLALEFGSDLGVVSPYIFASGDDLEVRHILKYTQEEGLEIWARALSERKNNPGFQINFSDLKPLMDPAADFEELFRTPDETEFFKPFRIDKAQVLFEAIMEGSSS